VSFVAVAIGGAAIVGAVASNVAANRQSDAVESGATNAAQATIESTRLQIDEIRRQFDYQQDILLPQIQSQYNAQGAFSDLLGIGGAQVGVNQDTGFQPQARSRGAQDQRRQQERDIYDQALARGSISQEEYDREISNIDARPYDGDRMAAENRARGPQFPGSGATQFQRGQEGQFIDPNIDPTRLQDINTLGDTVRSNLQAGTTAENDPYRNFIDDNQIASATPGQDVRVQRAGNVRLADGAAGTGVYGETFEASPGYAFQVEEANRASDRIGSAGGNYGGRAIIEAQRRAQGLAAGEYYNYAAGRERDLGRLGQAEAVDIGRGDTALSQFESQRIADVGRGDQAYQDYLRRREGDASRLDSAAAQEDSLIASDQARGDQSYYNYINNVGRVAGFGGGPAAQAVNASQVAGSATAGAYARQGGQLSGIYGGLGEDQANIEGGRVANINNSLISGAQNYATYQLGKPSPPPPGA